MKVYLSGPMTGLPDNNFPAFRAAAAELRAAGITVEDPSDKGIVPGWAWADYLRYDLGVLVTCDRVATLPGWRGSPGARLEVRVAKSLSMPVRPWKELLP
ncbi:DUF4406 domain-containing protein [Amycolatopsis sp. NPDC003731]